jgi:putative tryptophan/tyrosine transport system substrate-binding protein
VERRQFLALLVGTEVAWPQVAHLEQTDRVRKIGVLMGYAEGDREGLAFVGAFRDGLQKLG